MLEDKYKISKVKTMEQAIDSEAPSLAVMTKHYGEDFSVKLTSKLINRMIAVLSVGKNFKNPEQILFTAELIYEDYYFLKVAEVRLVLKNGIKGAYGELYDRMDASVVLNWFRKYREERMAFSEERSHARHRTFTVAEKTRAADNYINEIAERMQKKEYIKAKKEKK